MSVLIGGDLGVHKRGGVGCFSDALHVFPRGIQYYRKISVLVILRRSKFHAISEVFSSIPTIAINAPIERYYAFICLVVTIWN